MTQTTRKPSIGRDLASLSGWQIAVAYGCHYTGDMSPIPHGGVFYNLETWEEYGYASCVDIAESEGIVYVATGTINRAEGAEMIAALECCGAQEDNPDNPHVQVYACGAYFGMDRDNERSFSLQTWKEERIWEKMAGWISELGSADVNRPTGIVAALAERWAVGITSTDKGEFWGCKDNVRWIPFWDSMCDEGLEPTPFFEGEVFVGFRVQVN